MRNNVLVKCVLLAGLLMLFGISLLSVGGIVGERKVYRNQVINEVAAGAADRQRLIGPILVSAGQERVVTPAAAGETREARARFEVVTLPESLEVRSNAVVETRRRGIHKAQVFRSTHRLTAIFHVPPRLGYDDAARVVEAAPARWVFGVSDPRGLRKPPVIRVNGEAATVTAGSGQTWIAQGFSATSATAFAPEARRWVVEAEIELVGTSRLALVPIGGVTRFEIDGNWPHPSFDGSFLPDERRVEPSGFHAVWDLSRFATGVDDAIARWRTGSEDRPPAALDVGVTFFEPVDVYQLSERATKYGLLFVLLTFVAFFMFEVLKGLLLHPMHYALTGSAQAVFFLLLLSLSEHLPFVVAYLAASAACVGLITYYLAHVLGARARGLVCGAMLAVLYALLYVILQSKDYALLLGTLLLFGVLAAVMIVTRRVDWNRVGEAPKP